MQSYHLAATSPALCTAWMGRHPVFAGGTTPLLPEAPKRNDNPEVSSHTLLILSVLVLNKGRTCIYAKKIIVVLPLPPSRTVPL